LQLPADAHILKQSIPTTARVVLLNFFIPLTGANGSLAHQSVLVFLESYLEALWDVQRAQRLIRAIETSQAIQPQLDRSREQPR
jgi:hypothetical protein